MSLEALNVTVAERLDSCVLAVLSIRSAWPLTVVIASVSRYPLTHRGPGYGTTVQDTGHREHPRMDRPTLESPLSGPPAACLNALLRGSLVALLPASSLDWDHRVEEAGQGGF